MAAANPNGEQKFWISGQPFEGLFRNGDDMGTTKFWSSGIPGQYLYPFSSSTVTYNPFTRNPKVGPGISRDPNRQRL